MNNFIPQFVPQVRPKDIDAVQRQMLSGWVGPSKTTVKFENKIKEITGAKHCISTTSGTTAIMLALMGLKLPKGSTVLFPAYTFLAGANACRLLGYKIKLVDITWDTMCMSPSTVEDYLDEDINVSCVMFVNHNAYVGKDVQAIQQICDKYEIPMLEDSSQALGMTNAGRTGKVGVFSFSVPKLVTTGQGGAVITNDDEIASLCFAARDHGNNDWRKTRIHTAIGGNFKFNDILASYGLSQLEDIKQLLVQRKAIFDAYRKHLQICDNGCDSSWMVIYRSHLANEIIDALAKEDIQATKYYRPINHNPPYETKHLFSVAEFVYKDTIYLPSSLGLRETEIDKICDIVTKIEGTKV